jgi:murein DD-endopeptidase MepM/ murein hydrolase activator NlpD
MSKGVNQEGKIHRVSIFLSVLASTFFLIFFPESSFARAYIVKPGDYLVKLEKRFGVPWQDIKKINGLTSNTLYPGQKLVIPLQGVWHVVKEHQWLLLIVRSYGKAYGVSKEEIIQANRLKDPDSLVPGQKLFIPRAKRVLEIEIPPRMVSRDTAPSSRSAPTEKPEVEKKDLLFEWPLKGEVIGYFGEGGNQGIDIAGSEGETVVAAADGEVSYAGHLIVPGKNYGSTVFISHEEGLLTCYFYNAGNLVEKGQKVKKGDPIAKVGIMEDSGRFGLHFEIRKKSKLDEKLNPLDYLP